MNDRERRLKSVQSQLLQIYQDLFGVEYRSTGDMEEGTQFKAILQRFRQKHFYVRQMQKDREKKQKKGKGALTQQLLKNEKIRQEIKMCDNLLKEAQERIKNGLSKQDKNKYQKAKQSRRIMLDQCREMLNNLKTVEYGQSFEPRKQHQTLDQFKKRLIEDAPQNIDLEQEYAMQKFKRKDEQIEAMVTELRDVNKLVRGNLVTANEHIKVTQEMIENNMKVANRVGTKIEKGTADLRQVLKNYRRPSKLCLDVILVLLLLALIGVIINMVKGSVL